MININSIRKEDEEEIQHAFKVVKEKERLINETELMMQETSIYNENYKPKFIFEMDENGIKEFSKLLNQKLRHVKLAISKANLGHNKYKSENEQNLLQNKGPENPRSNAIKKHILNPKIFEVNKSLFSLDDKAKKDIKQYQIIVEEKNKKEVEKKDKLIGGVKDNPEIRQISNQIEILNKEAEIISNKINNNFYDKNFAASASRSVKLPDIKQNSHSKKYNSNMAVVSFKVASKYKLKDKMTVAEQFDYNQSECTDLMLSLVNPLKKLNKFTKKDFSNEIKSLINMNLEPNYPVFHQNNTTQEMETNIKFKNNSKQSEECSEFSSPKKIHNN